MSVDVITAVLQEARAKLGDRLVLLVIADTASRDGVAWLDQRTIAARARLSLSQTERCVKALERAGELEIRKAQRGRRRISVYRVTVGAPARLDVDYDRLPFQLNEPFTTTPQIAGSSAGDDPANPQPTTPQIRGSLKREPSSEPPEAPDAERRPRNVIWDELAALYGEPTTKTEKALRGKVVAEIADALDVGLTAFSAAARADEVRRRHEALEQAWGGRATVTPTALVKHWTFAGQAYQAQEVTAEEATPRAKAKRWLDGAGRRFTDEDAR